MADFTVATRNAWLDDFTSTTKYLALFDGDPQGAGTELTGGSYARVAVPAASWNAAAAGEVSNSAAINFPKATADWNSGTEIPYFAICTAGTAGVSDVEASDVPTVAKTVLSGDTTGFDAGELVLSIA